MSDLVRFRADLSKVRVSIRPCGLAWKLRIESRSDPERDNIETVHTDPETGMTILLEHAADHMEGIDLGMGGAYPHPMKG